MVPIITGIVLQTFMYNCTRKIKNKTKKNRKQKLKTDMIGSEKGVRGCRCSGGCDCKQGRGGTVAATEEDLRGSN